MAKKSKTTKKAVKKTAAKKTSKTVSKKATAKPTASAKKAKPAATKSAAVKMKPAAAKAKLESPSILGKTISDFSVLNSKGEVFTHDKLKGHKTVLYFYPKDDTPGCTIEGQQFSALKSEFDKTNTVVLGVSKDSSKSHDKFICKYDFTIDLLSDENEKLCKMFDVIKEKNMYGRTYMGIERSTFVLDENLKVIKEMRKVSANGHAQEILDFVKSL
jgi:thioredoxin-dependent peroxiredoxin